MGGWLHSGKAVSRSHAPQRPISQYFEKMAAVAGGNLALRCSTLASAMQVHLFRYFHTVEICSGKLRFRATMFRLRVRAKDG